MDKKTIFEKLQGGLIVSCQALENEPLHSSYIMSKMAVAAVMGGAAGIRANGFDDIKAIKQEVDVPIIGIVKRDYPDSDVFITPTLKEVEEVISSGADIVALDATERMRPRNQTLEDFYYRVRKQFGNAVLMADISTYEEGLKAKELGFDLVATTLSGYTSYSKNSLLLNIELLKALSNDLDVPVIAEGGIWTSTELQSAMESGAFASVVGTAITRPMEITKKFVHSLRKIDETNNLKKKGSSS
jgi:N-acylglucosamine-6-phosphate 2-epimerase